jgi:hypothetical protein
MPVVPGCSDTAADASSKVEEPKEPSKEPPYKKRKQVSDAEKVALELSKLTSRQAQQSMLKFEDRKIYFLNPNRNLTFGPSCTWKESKRWPCYCKLAEFSFEATLPERFYLTRYSVACSNCFKDQKPAFHLYCACCDEILTGSIAGPGGKVTDHVITIRHVVKEALALQAFYERNGVPDEEDAQRVSDYLCKLEQWSQTIRFPKNSMIKHELDAALDSLRLRLAMVREGAMVPLPPPRHGSRAPTRTPTSPPPFPPL